MRATEDLGRAWLTDDFKVDGGLGNAEGRVDEPVIRCM